MWRAASGLNAALRTGLEWLSVPVHLGDRVNRARGLKNARMARRSGSLRKPG